MARAVSVSILLFRVKGGRLFMMTSLVAVSRCAVTGRVRWRHRSVPRQPPFAVSRPPRA